MRSAAGANGDVAGGEAGFGDHQAPTKGSSSFLKKRTKKLLPFGVRRRSGPRQRDKSFLLLFFKKEVLSTLATPPEKPAASGGQACFSGTLGTEAAGA
jgi:hypothetical protein